MSKEKRHSNKRKLNDLINLATGLAIVVVLNFIASFVFHRFDLTSEKRYTLSEATKELTSNLDDVVYFKVYLEGEFPAGFKRLRRETKEMLDEFRASAPAGRIEYEFINPSESPDEKTRNEIYKQLYKQGLRPTDLEIKDEDGISQKIVWPGAIVTYKEREAPLDLLNDLLGKGAEEILNSSIENLEYQIASTINQLLTPVKPKIAFLEGHAELNEMETADIYLSLRDQYQVERLRLDNKIDALTSRQPNPQDSNQIIPLNNYDLLVIAKPDSGYTEKEKFLIDQHIMYGGKVLWLIDPMRASMDSLTRADLTMGIGRSLNLDDMLFTYGVRLNANLIQDLQAAPIPLPVGMMGDQPRYELFPWYYFPLLNPTDHPISKNLNLVKGEFVSTIDLVGDDKIKKEVLLETSEMTKLLFSPVRISLGITKFEPKPEQFNKPYQTVAVLLEGSFESVFKDRLTENFTKNKEVAFKPDGVPTQMIVVSDGDVIRNHVRQDERILPLGVDRYTQTEYGNKDFIMNCINYLCNDNGLMEVRSRSLKLRLLNKPKIEKEQVKWQMINMVLPLLLVVLLGMAHQWRKKRKYTK